MKLTLDAAANVAGYWSDGTASVEIAATLRNEGDLPLDQAVDLAVTCNQDREYVDGCAHEVSISLPDGYGPSTKTVTLRSPTGKVMFEIGYGGSGVQTLFFEAPKRIVGVDRNVWECFSDTSYAGTTRDDEGVGCAAWARTTVQKWDQTSPVKVSVTGPDGFVAEFKSVLSDLATILGLQFDCCYAEQDADVSAYVGFTISEAEDAGISCRTAEDFGCATTGTDSWSGESSRAEIIVFNTWPNEGRDLSDFDHWHRSRFRSAMIHETIHVFGQMHHRTELLSIMNKDAHHRAELTPMDEALLRLHGHELVRPGMTMAEIERLIVFNDELIDPQPADPRLQVWELVTRAYQELREATSARFRARVSAPGCSEGFGWTDYEVGNLTTRSPFFTWVRLGDRENLFYVLRLDSNDFEYWRGSQTGWESVSSRIFSDAVPGWLGNLSDPHRMLENILYYADWGDAKVFIDSNDRAVLSFELDMSQVFDNSLAESVEVVIVIDQSTLALLEYSMDWDLADSRCDSYRIEAKDAEYGFEMTLPDRVREGSEFIDDCGVESLGRISGSLKRLGTWARECGQDHNMEGYSRPYEFSLAGWSFVRFELSSADDTPVSLNLLRNDGSGASSILDLSANSSYFSYAQPGTQISWAHIPLDRGSYTVEAVTKDRISPGAFTLRISAQPTPPPPYRFKAISAGESRTCGLLIDGTPLCWGIGRTRGEGAEVPDGKFVSISAGDHTCALREDGTPVCWDFKQEGDHTCSQRADGSTFCRLNEQGPSSSDGSERDSALASATIEIIAGYFDQTPPADEELSSISTRGSYTCGLRRDGSAVCWGNNSWGQSSPPADQRFVSVDAGETHACGLRADGTAVCWGQDWKNSLGVPEGEIFVAVTAGVSHTCGLREDGSVECWGNGDLVMCVPVPGGYTSCRVIGTEVDFISSPPAGERFASLASGQPNCALRENGTPVCWPKYHSALGLAPPQGERFTSISSSYRHACALKEDGTAVCWGENTTGESSPPSGINLTQNGETQAPVGLVSISAGSYHTCGLDPNGATTCWGIPWWKYRFAERLTSISSGLTHVCGLRLDGSAVCHGDNRQGQSTPPPGEEFVSIAGGETHTCGLRGDGAAVCWGSNDSGQSTPPPGEKFVSISVGAYHTCGLRADNSAVCWGSNDHRQSSPAIGATFTSIASGRYHTCGLRADGAAVCWGSNDRRQSEPVDETLVSISSGPYHVCGLRADGSAVCWGGGGRGQASPPPDETFVSINCGEMHTCALRADGSVVCWGQDAHGQSSPRR